eukprot:CAMPEP_0172862680 /NCGR_PEP_ID=MMETSP1075-20121228/74981_1 /TAXON_ID=2916 /ORGANISM="Ceratium fusus, Strain PA161109" /LENGTH=234 /DNA_ID=CAMNT_0013711085 /DNA_START=36 /DNA_END=740 /DNA_ORIENTATION=+
MPAPRNPLSDAGPLPTPRNGLRQAEAAATTVPRSTASAVESSAPARTSTAGKRRSVSRSRSAPKRTAVIARSSTHHGHGENGYGALKDEGEPEWRGGRGRGGDFHGRCDQIRVGYGHQGGGTEAGKGNSHRGRKAGGDNEYEQRRGGGGNRNTGNTRVYISGLPDSITESTLVRRFSQYGEVLGVKIVYARPGAGRTSGIVRFSSAAAADASIAALEDKHDIRHAKPNPRWDKH